MGIINPTIPTIGDLNASEDPDIRNALITIRDEINGLLDNANIKTGANIDGDKLAVNSVPLDRLEGGGSGITVLGTGLLTSNVTTVAADPSYTDLTGMSFTTPATPATTDSILFLTSKIDIVGGGGGGDDYVVMDLDVGGVVLTEGITVVVSNDGNEKEKQTMWWNLDNIPANTLIKAKAKRSSDNTIRTIHAYHTKMICLRYG